jgi:hypothetical protein
MAALERSRLKSWMIFTTRPDIFETAARKAQQSVENFNDLTVESLYEDERVSLDIPPGWIGVQPKLQRKTCAFKFAANLQFLTPVFWNASTVPRTMGYVLCGQEVGRVVRHLGIQGNSKVLVTPAPKPERGRPPKWELNPEDTVLLV